MNDNKIENIDLENLLSENPKVKYVFAKQLLSIAKENPKALYPRLDFFVNLLENENQIIKWTSIDIIGYLSKVDEKKKIDRLLQRLFGFLNSGKLITANHAIFALSEIAVNKPEYKDKITEELLKVEHYNYDITECRNIAIGKVILALGMYVDQIENKKSIVEFLQRQTNNTRNATKKKAQELLKSI